MTVNIIRRASSLPRVVSPRRALEQVIVLASVVGTIWWLVASTTANLNARGVATGFAFLAKPASLGISESWISFTPSVDTYAVVLLAGLVNTLYVSALAILLATIIGVVIGLSRLSSNWLLSRSAGVYVELIRNVPLPLQLLLWYQILLNLPPPRNAISIGGSIALSNRGLFISSIVWREMHLLAAIGLLLLALVIAGRRWRSARLGDSAATSRPVAIAIWLAAALLIVIVAWNTEFEAPALRGFNFSGGSRLSPELAALVTGLSLYAAAFIGEIVRGGILAVPAGQWEAGTSLGLNRPQILRKIIFPLSLRLVIPPLASEYLSTIKNSSLAVIIGYPELTALVNTMLADTGQPIEAIAVLMLAYLTVSIAVSSVMNWYERHTELIKR